jgi:hypothetical protein
MNRSSGLRNKLIYMAIIVGMLLPLYLLGQPATGKPGERAGQLAQMRANLNLAEANLGEIDPASESMKLASLGLRGVAATLLWNKADEYKVLHEWDRLSATLNQIANLQPHYEKVWEHQAHNLAYNVSLEFDDYRQRYAWVKKGMDFLTEGVHKNRTAPRLIWYTGWFYGHKLGMSDEKTQFRELFRKDDPFHKELLDEGIAVDGPDARGADGRPDNWLVGRLWLNRGYDLVDGGVKLVDKSPVTFYEIGPKWRIQYATAIEEEGILDDRSKDAWERAADDWIGYGKRPISTTDMFSVQLSGVGDLHVRKAELISKFDALVGDTAEKMRQEQLASLSPQERQAIDTPERDRTPDQYKLALQANMKLDSNAVLVAKRAPQSVQLKAIQLAAEISDVDNRISKTNLYRDQMNYGYWELRCEAEQDDLVIEARRQLYDAKQLYKQSDLDGEIAKYDAAFKSWAAAFERYPGLILDVASDDLSDAIDRYRIATDLAELPEDFPLKSFYEMRLNSEKDPSEVAAGAAGGTTSGDGPNINILKPYSGSDDKLIPTLAPPEAALKKPEDSAEETSPADAPAPPSDSAEPTVEDEQPVVEDEQPVVEGEQPVVEGEQPVVEGEQSVVEGEQPVVEGEQPVVEGEQPVVEGEQPVVEGEQPVVEGEQPVVEGEQPVVEGEPATDD